MSLCARGLAASLLGVVLFVFDYFLNRFGGSLLIPILGRRIGEAVVAAVLVAAVGLIFLGIVQVVRGQRHRPRQIEPPLPISN